MVHKLTTVFLYFNIQVTRREGARDFGYLLHYRGRTLYRNYADFVGERGSVPHQYPIPSMQAVLPHGVAYRGVNGKRSG